MFCLTKKGFNPKNIISYGNMFLLGNGHLGYRGTLEEYRKKEMTGLTVVGFYDRYQNKWRESINLPNPFYVDVKVNGEKYNVYSPLMKSHEQTLDLKHAIFKRKTKFDNLLISSERFVLQALDNVLMMKYTVCSLKKQNVELTFGIDGDVFEINGPHFKEAFWDTYHRSVSFHGVTNEDKNIILTSSYRCNEARLKPYEDDNIHGFQVNKELNENETFVLYVYTAIKEHSSDTKSAINEICQITKKSYLCYKKEQKEIFNKKWDIANVTIRGNKKADFALRYSIYHLLILGNAKYATSIPARGVSGQTYKGAIFWDSEVFMLPFYILTDPSCAKKLIEYRIKTLSGAKRKAEKYGYLGAFYAWESQEDGNEACSKYNVTDAQTHQPIRTYFNEKQIHISGDISFAFSRYRNQTKDDSLLYEGGFEMVIEIAKFFVSYSTWVNQRYEIHDVIGPDEYHERVNNNAFTNYLAYFSVNEAVKLIKNYPDLASNQDIEMLDIFESYLKNLYLPKPNEDKIIPQFDGYFDLEDVDVETVRSRLKYPNEYWGCKNGVATPTRVIKQADVITLLALFPDLFDDEIKKANYEFYNRYTEHGSSLSASMYSLVGANVGYEKESYDHFYKSATIDLGTNQKMYAGGIYIGGTHPASNGGAYLSVIYGFCQLNYQNGESRFKSKLPSNIKSISFKILDNGSIKKVEIDHEQVKVLKEELV